MNDIRPRETVIMADDLTSLAAWYRDVLGFRLDAGLDDEYSYVHLNHPSGIALGIASAQEMGIRPTDRNANTILLQFEVTDVRAFFEHVVGAGGEVLFGPSFDERLGYWYGGLTDREGNPFWVVDAGCPRPPT